MAKIKQSSGFEAKALSPTMYKERKARQEIRETTGVLSEDESIVGLYRFVRAYPLFDNPEHYMRIQTYWPVKDSPIAMTTGKIFSVNGTRVAWEIIVTHKECSKVTWTIPNLLQKA